MTTYYFDGEVQQNQELMEYELGYVPEGFIEIHRRESDNETAIFYENTATNEMMNFTYIHECDDYTHNVDLSNTTVETVSINGINGDYYEHVDKESKIIVWYDSTVDTLFSISAYLDKTELIALAESICK